MHRERNIPCDEEFVCPYCGELQEDTLSAYVIPSRFDEASRAEEECWECNKIFEVQMNRDASFTILWE